MRVEILENRISDQDPETEHLYVVHLGDVLTVPDSIGARWCHYGWAKDLETDSVKRVETGDRIEGSRDVHESDPRRVERRVKVKPDTPLDVHKSSVTGRK